LSAGALSRQQYQDALIAMLQDRYVRDELQLQE
jgi:hypothetical protein